MEQRRLIGVVYLGNRLLLEIAEEVIRRWKCFHGLMKMRSQEFRLQGPAVMTTVALIQSKMEREAGLGLQEW
ncbi:hypothetical protein OPV22_000151 [Ensete ventricosum]|uniref:Uncharacterized protein n=1 Tax=Ensete ventricosum TaxID=4639 RepID=A0AAV8RSI7_ENSVE|nr:hypothetical protein OPV22_000151 [Ensete ventricosum]